MTLEERREDLAKKLDAARNTFAKYQEAIGQLRSQMDQLTGAIVLLDQLIMEDGHAGGEQGAAAVHGHEVRPSETVEER